MKLSICIPVFNNIDLFRHSILFASESITGYEEHCEIVVSDNCSEDDIRGVIDDIKQLYKRVKFVYSRNEMNKGLASNFHKVVELAKGEFCWIVGSDDFIHKCSVSRILEVIKNNEDVDFISVSFNSLDLNNAIDIKNKEDPYNKIQAIDLKGIKSRYKTSKIKTGKVSKWDKLIEPSFNNVMLGSVMAGVFRRSLWESVDKSGMDKTDKFCNVQNIYPHVYVYSKSMIGKIAYYISEPVLTVGDGARPWVGNNFWEGSLPIIYLKVFNEIIGVYKSGGLSFIQVIKCKLSISHIVGRYLFPYIVRKYFYKKSIKSEECIKLERIVRENFYIPTFYVGLLKGILKVTFRRDQNE